MPPGRPRSANPRPVVLALRITKDMRSGLREVARREGVGIAEVVRRVLEARLYVAGLSAETTVQDAPTAPHFGQIAKDPCPNLPTDSCENDAQ